MPRGCELLWPHLGVTTAGSLHERGEAGLGPVLHIGLAVQEQRHDLGEGVIMVVVVVTVMAITVTMMKKMTQMPILTTSCRPWKQARVRAVFLFVSIWALMSLPMSSSSFTAAVCPFMAASIRGLIPSLEPVRELISAPWANSSLMMLV